MADESSEDFDKTAVIAGHEYNEMVSAARVWSITGTVLLPAVGFILWLFYGNELWGVIRLLVPLAFVLGIFIPMYVFGKKYE